MGGFECEDRTVDLVGSVGKINVVKHNGTTVKKYKPSSPMSYMEKQIGEREEKSRLRQKTE